MTAEKLGEFFGIDIVDAYVMYSDMDLIPFTTFSTHYIREMDNLGFDLVEKGGNYMVFKHRKRDIHIGIIYDDIVRTYRFVQW